MKINPEDIKVPLEKIVETKNGETQVSLAKMADKKAMMYKSFMSTCASDDKALVDTTDMDDQSTMKACSVQFDKMQAVLMEESDSGELTPAQKKLPPALQKAILKKMDKPSDPESHENEETEEEEKMEEGEDTEDESDASGQSSKMLSKDNESKEKFDGETLKINK
jgi:hypothetical protein